MDPGLLDVGGRLQVPGRNSAVVDDGDVLGGLQVVADVSARDAIPSAMRKRGMIARLYDGTEYSLNADLQTWELVSNARDYGKAPVVAGLAALKALPVAVGQRVHETTRGFDWLGVEADTAIANDDDVVNASGGQWVLVPGSSKRAAWIATAEWYVGNRATPIEGEVAASNWNAGQSTTPLASVDEVERRYGSGVVLSTDVTIHLLSNVGTVRLSARASSSTLKLTIRAYPRTIQTTTIASYTPKSHGTYGVSDPTPERITANAISSWTSQSIARYRVRSGNAVAWIDTPTPDGLVVYAANVASTCPWVDMQTSEVVTPTVNSELIVEELTTVGDVQLQWSGTVAIRDATLTAQVAAPFAYAVNRHGCYYTSSCKSRVNLLFQFGNNIGCRSERTEVLTAESWRGGYGYNTTLLLNTDGIASVLIQSFLSRISASAPDGYYNFGHFGIGTRGMLMDVMAFQHSNNNVIRWGDNYGSTCQSRSLGIQGFSCVSERRTAIVLATGVNLIIYRSHAFNPVTRAAGGSDFGVNPIGETKDVSAFSWGEVSALSATPFKFEPGVWRGSVQLLDADQGQRTITLSPKLSAFFTADVKPRVWTEVPADTYGLPYVASQTGTTFVLRSATRDTSIVGWEVKTSNLLDIAIWVR